MFNVIIISELFDFLVKAVAWVFNLEENLLFSVAELLDLSQESEPAWLKLRHQNVANEVTFPSSSFNIEGRFTLV